MARQARRIKAEKQAAQEVDERMATAVAEAKGKALPCTAEDIIRERDERGLSWAQVAKNLDLKSPGAARAAYTKLTGRPHTESVMQGRAARGTGVRATNRKTAAPEWGDDSDQDEIEAKLNGRWIEESGSGKDYTPGHWSGSTIVIRRKHGYEEEVRVKQVTAFTFGKDGNLPLTIEFRSGNGAFRAVYAKDIKEVR